MKIIDKFLSKKKLSKKKMYEFVFDDNGKHQIGGDFPSDFKIPENEFKSNFQYLGYIDNLDKRFNWLPFKLNMICPIYLDIDFVYLDYENPNEPKILYPNNTSEIGTEYEILDTNSIIIYEAKRFSLEELGGVTEDNEFDIIGISGKPNWTQNKNIPICPKTNRKMEFVCQLTSWSEVKTKFTNVIGGDYYEQELFSKINFGYDGDLYVFIEPQAKTVCYFIQRNNLI